jgi:hypothetical protein
MLPARTPAYWTAVTPNDTIDLGPCVGLFVGTGGVVMFDGNGGATATVTVPNNFYLWGDVRKVYATNTTASGIFQLR